MTITDRPSQSVANGQLSREQILEITLACLREHGYDDTTIRRIAGRLRCAVGSIYRYFTDKRELLLGTTQQILEPVVASLEQGASFDVSVQHYANIARADCESYRLMFWLAAVPHKKKLPAVDGAKATTTEVITPHRLPPIVLRIVERWASQLGNEEQALRTWGVLHGLIVADLPTPAILQLLDATNSNTARHGGQLPMDQMVTLLTKPSPKATPRPLPTPIPEPIAAAPINDATPVEAEARPTRSDDVTLL